MKFLGFASILASFFLLSIPFMSLNVINTKNLLYLVFITTLQILYIYKVNKAKNNKWYIYAISGFILILFFHFFTIVYIAF
jgi:hypothetical protein